MPTPAEAMAQWDAPVSRPNDEKALSGPSETPG